MNTLKSTSLSVFSALVLAGCGAQKQYVNYNSLTAITAPENLKKNRALTDTELKRWSHSDIVKDTIPGMSVDRTYAELLKNRKSETVIVGIVDSGVDIEHEDLKSVLWTNTKEIPNNGIDDDNNGYIDDIHGWNFLGDITKENLEYERILQDKSLVDEATYLEAKKLADKKLSEAESGKANLTEMITEVTKADNSIKKELEKKYILLTN